jgi:hypothetical protein
VVNRAAWLVAAVVLFAILATANAGGYRYGASDQAFYIPAVALRADDSLLPRDREVFEPQMHLWLGDEALAAVVRTTGIPLPALFALLQGVTLATLALGAALLARSLGCSWWSIATCLLLLTLRHRIARTGANSLEGYMHPRMLAFGLGLCALSFTARARPLAAGVWTVAAAMVHTSTAVWFAAVVGVAAVWPLTGARWPWRFSVLLAALAAALAYAAVSLLPFDVMDAPWLAVLADRDYLFSADWPAYAWLSNLAYPLALWLIFRRRVSAGVATPAESHLVAGLCALVGIFLLTIPLAERHLAFFVQLQANRVFWVLDGAVAVYVSWWLIDDVLARHSPRRRFAVVTLLLLLSAGRGYFVLHETGRPLIQMNATQGPWRDAMRWLETQPVTWHVLADPAHALKYGISVRAAAFRDTPLESGKDPAMAMYDRHLARRVAERSAALAGFDDWTSAADVMPLDARYNLDVFIDRADRRFDLPVLFQNDGFVVYDLR